MFPYELPDEAESSGEQVRHPTSLELSPRAGRLLRGEHGAPSLEHGSPVAMHLGCVNEVGEKGGSSPDRPVPPAALALASLLPSHLLVLTLGHW